MKNIATQLAGVFFFNFSTFSRNEQLQACQAWTGNEGTMFNILIAIVKF